MPRHPVPALPTGATSFWHVWSLLWLGSMLVLPFLAWTKAPPTPSFHAEAIAAGLGLFACAALAGLSRRLVLPRAALLFPAFALLIGAQMLLGWIAFPQQGLLAVLYLTWAAALAVLASTLRRELGLERVVSVLAWFLAAGLILNCVVGLAQQFQVYGPFARYVVAASPDRMWGNLAQPNHLADYLALGLAGVGFLVATRRLHALPAAAIAAIALYVLVQTGTRAALLYLIAMLAGAAWLAWRAPDQTGRRLLGFAALCLLAYLLLPVALRELAPAALDPDGAWSRWRGQALAQDLRGRLWHAAWEMFVRAPALGQGFREYAFQYFLLNPDLPPEPVGGFHDHAHNLPLHVMAEFGIAGLSVLVLGTATWGLGLRRLPAGAAAWWVLAVAAVLAIHSLLEYPLWYTFFLGPAALVLGLGEGATVEFAPSRAAVRRVGGYVLIALVLGAIALAQLVRDYLVLESFAAARERYLHATEAANRRAEEMLLEVHRTSLLAPLVELGLARSIRIESAGLGEKLVVNGRTMRVFPVEDVVYRQAMLLALAGEHAAASRQWRAAAAAFPATEPEALAVLRERVQAGVTGLAPLLTRAGPAAEFAQPSTSKE